MIHPQLAGSGKGDGACSISVGRRAKCYQKLELLCRRNVSSRSDLEILLCCLPHTPLDSRPVNSTKFFRRERSCFISIRFFFFRWMGEIQSEKEEQRRAGEVFPVSSAGETLPRTSPTTPTPLQDYHLQDNNRRCQQRSEDPCAKK